jgi:branched-chain amino acid transport system substrate-binding protein
MRGRRATAGLASVVVAAGVLAAVVPVSAGAEAPSQQFPPVDQPGVTQTEINVGGVVSKTNPLGGDYASAFDGVKAYFNMVNASKDKGIYGRKLKLSSERDDQVSNNQQEVQALLSNDNVFAVLPIASLLFTGAQTLGQSGVPTFGWNINAEWGSEQAAGSANLFGERGSYTCFTCPGSLVPLVAKTLHKKKIGVLAYQVAASSDSAKGIQASFDKYPGARIVFLDTSLAFGVTDLSSDVQQMKDKGVDLVVTSMDNNGTLTLAKEMKKQGLNAIQYLPDAYNQKFISENAPFFQGSYALTFFTPFELKDKPTGLKNFQKWMKKGGFELNQNAMAGWLNADLFYQGLKAAGPDFTRQKVVDAINKMTDYSAGGLLGGVDWTTGHSQETTNGCVVLSKVENGKFVPSFGEAGKPFVCYPNQPDKLPAKFVPASGVAGFSGQ